MVKDPVTGVVFDVSAAVAVREHSGNVLYFATQESVDIYDEDPHYYGHPEHDEEYGHHGH